MKDYTVTAEDGRKVYRFSRWDAEMTAAEWRRTNPELKVKITLGFDDQPTNQ